MSDKPLSIIFFVLGALGYFLFAFVGSMSEYDSIRLQGIGIYLCVMLLAYIIYSRGNNE